MNITATAALLVLLVGGGSAETECRYKQTTPKPCPTGHCKQQAMPSKQVITADKPAKKMNNTPAPKAPMVPVQMPKTVMPQSAAILLTSVHQDNSAGHVRVGNDVGLPSPASKLVLPSAIIKSKKLEATLAAQKQAQQQEPVQAEETPSTDATPLVQEKLPTLDTGLSEPVAVAPSEPVAVIEAPKQAKSVSAQPATGIASKQPIHAQPVAPKKPVHVQPATPKKPVRVQPVAPKKPIRVKPVAPKKPIHVQPVAPKKPVLARPVKRSVTVKQSQPAKQPVRTEWRSAKPAVQRTKQPMVVVIRKPQRRQLAPANAHVEQRGPVSYKKKPNNTPFSRKRRNAGAIPISNVSGQSHGRKHAILHNYLLPFQELFKQPNVVHSTAKSAAAPKPAAQSVFTSLTLKAVRCLNSLFQHLFGGSRVQAGRPAVVF